jgi:putative flippase GtrA
MNTLKKDYLVAAVAGFYTALLLLPTFKNIDIGFDYLYVALLFVIPILWIIGLTIAYFLSKLLSFLYQFGKFVVVGFANTAIDFGVLNILSILTQKTSGFFLGGVNLPGFVIAAVHSYFWNKFWVFKKPLDTAQGKPGEPKQKPDYSDFWTFLAVVLVGVFVNGGIVVGVTTYMDPKFGFTPERWLNIAKVAATAISLVWNFIGFKIFVFKPKEGTAPTADKEISTV